MSADLDVRAWIYCNIGPVISGNLEESSIVGAGLITVTGNVVLNGVFNVREGQVVELSYYKNGRIARFGRKLKVINSYANPVTRTTEIKIGCSLALKANTEPPPQTFNSKDDTDGLDMDLDPVAKYIMIKPTRAKYVAEQICAAVGITSATIPLTNEFYRPDFKVSGAYLRTLSDLLISENFVGYMDNDDILQFIDLNKQGGRGPVLDEERIIDIAPINVGDQDASVVYSIVNFKKIKLDQSLTGGGGGAPDEPETIEEILERNDIPEEEAEKIADAIVNDTEDQLPEEIIERTTYGYRNPYWLSGYTTEPPAVRRFRYQKDKKTNPVEEEIVYSTSSSWKALYSPEGELISRTEIKGGVWGEYITQTDYSSDTRNGVETTIEKTTSYVPGAEIVEACGFPPSAVIPLPSYIQSTYPVQYVLAEQVTTKTVATSTDTITTESTWRAAIYTSAGAANIHQYIASFYDPKTGKPFSGEVLTGPVLGAAINFVFDKTRVTYGQKNPSQSIRSVSNTPSVSGASPVSSSSIDFPELTPEEQDDLLNRELETDLSGIPDQVLDTDNTEDLAGGGGSVSGTRTWSLTDVPEVIYSQGAGSGIMLELTPPYMSDDKIIGADPDYQVIPSDAKEKVKAFAEKQNKLRFGYRNGQAIVFPVEYLPTKPFSPIYLKFGGVVGQYRTDRLSIAFDNTGILVSTDAIFWGGVGQ